MLSSYRLLRTFFADKKHWNQFDPFFAQKADTYKSSSAAIVRTYLSKSTAGSASFLSHRDSLIDLARSLQKLDGKEAELEQGYEQAGSALEVVF
jgi:hypothetical protein